MFGIGETELVIIVVFGFLLFGPDKLPGMGRTIGRALRQFREAQEGFQQVVQAEVMDPLNDAMNAPAKKAALDDDADIEGSDAEVAGRKTETFAERKARLQAERKAKADAELKAKEEAEKAAAEAAEQDADAPASEADEDAAQPKAEPASEPAAAEPETAPAENSVAALYAMTPRKRAPKAEPMPEPEPEAEPAPVEEPAEAPAETPQTDEPGKEDESEA